MWVFGGVLILVSVVLFDIDGYSGGIVFDLFGDDCFFVDVVVFWIV